MFVVALPGFSRGLHHLQRFADACASAGIACVRPQLAPRVLPVLYMRRIRLRRIAHDLVPSLTGPVVIAGHSAGAAAGCWLAGELIDLGVEVRGVVLIDGVDSPNRLIEGSISRLQRLRIAAVLAPPSPCNRRGALAAWLEGHPSVRVTLVPGAGHGDIEGAGLGIYRRVCGDTSDVETADRFLAEVMAAITWCGEQPERG